MSDNVKGILWALVATAMFTLAAAVAKIAVDHYHVLQILFFRQLLVFLSALPSMAKNFPQNLKTQHPKIHCLRLIGAFIALCCSIWGVAVLPLTTATTLWFTQVFFVTLIAVAFLNEQAGIHRKIAMVCGFLGVIVVMRPGVEGTLNIHTLIPVVGALGAAVAVSCVRKLSQTESTATLLAYQAIFVGLLAGIPLFWLWTSPDLYGYALLLGMGVLATVGQWVGVKSLRLGEASVVSNIEYVKLVYAAILGFVLFAEIPDAYTLTGAGIIILSCLYLYHRERVAKASSAKG